ncbi:RidA family protein [Haladaptatus sp. DYF46]|uniref:RidA family protein n=1 Tax=Haladaptatus sp. DYF46 TaxID=2886041 RepID=UPI001E40354F|nr:RidA family protein [Haladaptatus sp. DYF46]
MKRKTVTSGTEWEERVGYSRAVRVGNDVRVSGTTATDEEGNVIGEGDAYRQTKRVLENVESALVEAGASIDDVVRTRMFVTDIENWEPVGEAHAEFFGDVRPATSMVEVSGLIDPEMVVEIEADAVITA